MPDLYTRLDVFEKLLLCNGNIYFWQYSPDFKLIYSNCPDTDFWQTVFSNSSCCPLLSDYIKENRLPFLMEDELNFIWIAVSYWKNDTPESIFIIGPVLSSNVTEAHVSQHMNHKNFSLKFKRDLIHKLESIPVIPIHSFLQYGRMLYCCIYEQYINTKEISTHTVLPELSDPKFSNQNFHSTKHESSRYNEHLLKKIVREGNIHYKSLLTSPRSHPSPGILSSDDPLRQAKNEMIVLSVILSRAAIEGGYPAENALSLNDYYIQAIEQETYIPNIYSLANKMIDTFVNKVHDFHASPNYSDLIKQCISYMELHLLEHFDLATMATSLGYDKYYLSKCFKRETGMRISSYMKQKRIEYSKLLLKDSHLKISDISIQLDFSNPSHFIATFKKQTGLTPKEYRGKC